MSRAVWYVAGLACLAIVVSVAPAKAMMIAPQPVPMRVAAADAVVVGKVTGFGPKTIKAEMFKGDMRDMQIAIVKVQDVLSGKAGKEIKVGFFPPPAVNPGGGPGGVRPFIKRRVGPQLAVDQEAAMFLQKHPTKDLYVLQGPYSVIDKKNNATFAKSVEEIKKAGKVLANPKASLQVKNAEERFANAAVLLAYYRTPRAGSTKTEELSAEESKPILLAIAEADWTPKRVVGFQMTPQTMFYRLGVGPKDGWVQPKDFKEIPEAAKKWLKDNAGKYKIQRFVAPRAEASAEGGK
jgi:hypothetical protein